MIETKNKDEMALPRRVSFRPYHCALVQVLALGLLPGVYGSARAQQSDVSPCPAGAVAHLDGLDIEFDANCQWSKIYSTYTQPVEFSDRRGIKTAQIIAEEKGKGQIVRFLNQKVESDRIVEEMESSVVNTKSTKGTGDKDGAVKTAERKQVASVKEFARSYASGSLKGVTVIEAGYDEKKEEVWVKVGLSKTMMGIAKQLGDDLKGKQADGGTGASDKKGITSQPSEVRSRVIR
jgi:hypothetical protein